MRRLVLALALAVIFIAVQPMGAAVPNPVAAPQAIMVMTPQVQHGPTFPPDPWDGRTATRL